MGPLIRHVLLFKCLLQVVTLSPPFANVPFLLFPFHYLTTSPAPCWVTYFMNGPYMWCIYLLIILSCPLMANMATSRRLTVIKNNNLKQYIIKYCTSSSNKTIKTLPNRGQQCCMSEKGLPKKLRHRQSAKDWQ